MQQELSNPVEVECVMRQMAHRGAMIEFMTPDIQKRNIHRHPEKVLVSEDGAIEEAILKPEAAQAVEARAV